jgi:hypothetical protein
MMEDEIEQIIHNAALRILPQDSLDTRKKIMYQMLAEIRALEHGWLKMMLKRGLNTDRKENK